MELHKIMINREIFNISLMCLYIPGSWKLLFTLSALQISLLNLFAADRCERLEVCGGVRAVCPGAQSCPESSLSGLTNL